MGRQGQPVRSLRRDRRHGHHHQRWRRHGAGRPRQSDAGSQRARHTAAHGKPAAGGPERQPGQPGTGAAGVAEPADAGRTLQIDEGNPAAYAGEARPDHRARRRQDGGLRPQRDRQEHRRHHQEPRRCSQGAARRRRGPRTAIRGAAQGSGRLRRRIRSGDDGRAGQDQCGSRLRESLAGRRGRGGTVGRAARRHHRQHQPAGFRHDSGTGRQQQRFARADREGIQDRPEQRQIQPRHTPGEQRHRRVEGRRVEIAGAWRGQDQRLQDLPEGTRRRRLRPAHP